MRVDVHQHLWTTEFVDALRNRTAAPRLTGEDGWTLILESEPPARIDPRDHDCALRLDINHADGLDLALICPSAPLGIEHLPPAEAAPLLDAYHRGVLALGAGFGAWAAAAVTEPDPRDLADRLDAGCVGLQLPATALADEEGYAACAPLLRALEERGKPLFVHPGRARSATTVPWWAANVDYVQQMHAAYYAFAAYGRPAHKGLKVCFAMLGGLAPLHWERAVARGGPAAARDPLVWFETSSYGASAVAALSAALTAAAGGDAPAHPAAAGPARGPRLVPGSDRPYAAPALLLQPATAARATAELLGLPAGTLRNGS